MRNKAPPFLGGAMYLTDEQDLWQCIYSYSIARSRRKKGPPISYKDFYIVWNLLRQKDIRRASFVLRENWHLWISAYKRKWNSSPLLMNGKTRSCFKVVRRLLFVIFVNASFHDAKVVIKQEETKCVQFLGNNIYMTANDSRPQ